MNANAQLEGSRRRRKTAPAMAGAKRVSHIGLAILALLLALLLLISGARLLLAGIADYQAEAFLGAWSKARVEPDARAWAVAESAAQRAVSLSPAADGDRFDRLGRVYSWQHFRQPYGAAHAADSRRLALAAYRASVQARPTWPYTWARLAHSKLYLLEFDAEFSHALAQAFAMGPTRIAVNRELADIGLSAWPQLSAEQRQATLESVRRSVAYNVPEAQNMLSIAKHNGRVEEFCGALEASLISSRKLDACQE